MQDVDGLDGVLAGRAERLAERLLEQADAGRGRGEAARQARVARLLDDDAGLAFTLALTDEVLRIRDRRRAGRHLRAVLRQLGSPRFLGPVDRALLAGGAAAAARFPDLVVPLVAARLRTELAGYVRPAERRPLGRYLARRRSEGLRLNLNLLGEAVLGEGEADRRMDAVLRLLGRPDVDYVSVKVTSVCSQLDAVDFDGEVRRVSGRLRRLYEAAGNPRRGAAPKFVNLDMEEYRDLDLTVAVFRQVLSEPAFRHLDAGIVLQAYLPDSLGVLRSLLPWAVDRHRQGGGRIKVRVVKGANLAMERVEAELAGWEQAPYPTKADVDASYKRMIDVLLDPAHAGAVRVGVASHNLLELAWALTVAAERGVPGMVEAEMLEGMAGAAGAPVRDAAGGLLLYAPIVGRSDLESAIAYLVRRFDENTGPDNFLRHQFSMHPGSEAWRAEVDRFRVSVAARHLPSVATRRTQDRREPVGGELPLCFANAAETDLSRAANREWLASWLVADVDWPEVGTSNGGTWMDGRDPSRPATVAYRWRAASVADVDTTVAGLRAGREAWAARSGADRRDVLLRVADELEARRGRLVGLMAADGGKVFRESDPEVSEAVDFARYYAFSAAELDRSPGLRFEPFGTVAVVPPWNFPLAIPAGGVLAALAAGNTVVLKPAPETVAIAAVLAEACWAGGVPTDALAFLPCADDDAGRRLVTHPDIDAVVLTGAWETARMFLSWRPSLRLHGETSGKNAIVVTAAADLDGAVADLVRSAFGHAGQKCSAASLGILEGPVYDDPRFRRQLADAAASLRPGPAWAPGTTMGPVIRPPEGPLLDALTTLAPGESWLLEPRQDPRNPQLWSPGIKLGVAPGSPFHLTECFGPVLGLMRASDLDEALAWQNQPAYGLTAGLHSLDPDEISRWLDQVEAGNLYVNRHITGAVVRRQPFGGWKRSAVGPGAKAGGPNYVASLGRWVASGVAAPPAADAFGAEVVRIRDKELVASDPSGLTSEANVLRYRPLRRVLVRAGEGVAPEDVERVAAAGRALGVAVTVASGPVDDWLQLAGAEHWDQLRILGDVPDDALLAAYDTGVWVDRTPFVADPAVEAHRWVREQAVSVTRHRHGNLTGRYDGVIAGL